MYNGIALSCSWGVIPRRRAYTGRRRSADAWNRPCTVGGIVPTAAVSVLEVVPATLLLYTGSAVLAFVLAALFTPFVGRFAERIGMMDIPGGRRLHPRPIARPGGLAIAIAFGLTIFIFWLIGMNVALNFIDGLDGLAAGIAAIAAATLGAIALLPQIQEPFVAWMAFSLAGATLGFLIYNFHPARLFMGTSGVVFVGTMLAVLSIFGSAKVAAALLVLGVPIIDTFYVLVRRVLSGHPPFAPDRGHFHHRLLDVGLTHQQAVLLIYGMTAVLGTLAFMTNGRDQIAGFIGLAVLLGIAVVVLTQRSSKAKELDPAL